MDAESAPGAIDVLHVRSLRDCSSAHRTAASIPPSLLRQAGRLQLTGPPLGGRRPLLGASGPLLGGDRALRRQFGLLAGDGNRLLRGDGPLLRGRALARHGLESGRGRGQLAGGFRGSLLRDSRQSALRGEAPHRDHDDDESDDGDDRKQDDSDGHAARR